MRRGVTTRIDGEGDANLVAQWIAEEGRDAPFLYATSVKDAVEYVLEGRGGYLRGRLVLITAGDAVQLNGEFVRNAVCAVEILHLASLVHDDVIDFGVTRRGKPTAIARFGQTTAAFSGGWLCVRASELVSSCGDDALAAFVAAADRMCRGGMLEMRDLHNFDRTVGDCMTAARLKTGSTFELAAR